MTAGPAEAASAVVVGIDAGGTRTRARALRNGVVFYEGAGGPGNPVSASEATLEASYRAALAGCADATHVCACVAGTGGPAQQAQIARLLTGILPGALIKVVPDYAAAVHGAPDGTDVCVIAGTGSIICSQAFDGTYAVTGGLGWILGDRGSATRLGQVALETFANEPEALPLPSRTAIERILGDGDWRVVACTINSSAEPARLLARSAPLLTAAAERGEEWATRRLDCEMAALAAMTARHIRQHVTSPEVVHVTLSGGVWASPVTIESFTSSLMRLSASRVEVAQASVDPIEGAARLAANMIR